MKAHIVAHSGNDSHMRNSEMLVANLELTASKGDECERGLTTKRYYLGLIISRCSGVCQSEKAFLGVHA